eukprot:137767-Pleurochrysis_carterae.AAC.1
MQQKIDLLLLKYQTKLERDNVVRSALPLPLPPQHSSSELAGLPGPKFLVTLPTGSQLWMPYDGVSVPANAP